MGNPGETLLFQHRKATFRAHALKSFKKRIKIVVGRLGGKVTEFYHPLAGISLSIGAFESSRGGNRNVLAIARFAQAVPAGQLGACGRASDVSGRSPKILKKLNLI